MMLVVPIVPAAARPVSYAGGVTIMTMNNGDTNGVHANYSLTAFYSIGAGVDYNRDHEYYLYTAQLNNLLKRWNNPDSQANLYLESGVGIADSHHGATKGQQNLAGFTGISVDWEDRRFFVSYSNRYTEAGSIDGYYQQSARVGVTPYIGDYGDLHTWLMVQIDHQPEADNAVTVTPLVRLFKGTQLLEAGLSNQGDVLFNLTLQF
jgi:hypothetical protein